MRSRIRTQGMATPLVLAIILALAAVGGAAYYASQERADTATPTPSPKSTTVPNDEIDNSGAGPGIGAPPDKGGPGTVGFSATGEVLAGSTTPFIDFNQADYEQALRENRIILLYFYANWCPICRVELSRTHAAFDELALTNVVGFRVSYSDNETDDFEENLARQFGIAYQHTKVILKGGQQVLKNGETWSKDRYLEELMAVAQ